MIFRKIILILFSIILLNSCVGIQENEQIETRFGPREQIFYSDFPSVWRATQLALASYPIRVNNMDLGILDSEEIKGFRAWTPPHQKKKTGGFTYNLNVRVVKGSIEGKDATKVSIVKNIEVQKDFFSNSKKLPSDGLEEQTILYRIGREIQIDKGIQKLLKRKQNK